MLSLTAENAEKRKETTNFNPCDFQKIWWFQYVNKILSETLRALRFDVIFNRKEIQFNI